MASRKEGRSPKTPKSKSPQKRVARSDSSSPKISVSNDLARRLRDLCASWHELVQKWENLNTLGINIANKLMNLQLQKHYSEAEDASSVSVLSNLNEASTSELQDEIVKTLQELSGILHKMGDVLLKMETLSKNFHAAKELKNFKSNEEAKEESYCIFKTWNTGDFCSSSDRLMAMYRKELSLKEKLFSSFTTTNDRDTLMVFLSLWLHKPYIDDDHDVILESMLIETDLR